MFALDALNPPGPFQLIVYGGVPPVIRVLMLPVLPPLQAMFWPKGSMAGVRATPSTAGAITFQLCVRVHAASVTVTV